MKSFFKYLLASILGFVLSFILILIIFFAIVIAVSSSSDKPVNVTPNSVLKIKLNKQIVDRQPDIPFGIEEFASNMPIGLNLLLENIAKAKNDDNIQGIFIEFSTLTAGNATLEELRNALLDFKETGKFVVCYGEYYSQPGYYLASVADEVLLNPSGMFYLAGASTTRIFFKNTLKKLGIEATVLQTGDYKSFGEMYSRESMSDKNREQTQEYLNTFWNEWINKISLSRNISETELNVIANNLLIQSNSDAVKYNLIDKLVYKDEVLDLIKEKVKIAQNDKLKIVPLNRYKKVPAKRNYRGLAKDKVAIVYASGVIVMGQGDDENVGSERFSKTLRKIRKDSTIKAVVLRVNSPGGSALASEVIWREIQLTKKVKPVIVSMGDVAASGGYYISCSADTILTNKQTITGSVGVILTYMNTEGFLDKLGISTDHVNTHKHSDFINGLKDLSMAEKTWLENQMYLTYDTFLYRVANGREMSIEEVKTLAQGRVWTGEAALQNNFADVHSGLTKAIEIAAEIAGIEDKYRTEDFPKLKDPFERIFGEVTGDAKIKKLLKMFGLEYRDYKNASDIISNKGLQYVLPEQLNVE